VAPAALLALVRSEVSPDLLTRGRKTIEPKAMNGVRPHQIQPLFYALRGYSPKTSLRVSSAEATSGNRAFQVSKADTSAPLNRSRSAAVAKFTKAPPHPCTRRSFASTPISYSGGPSYGLALAYSTDISEPHRTGTPAHTHVTVITFVI
jgi:hypothetical protein